MLLLLLLTHARAQGKPEERVTLSIKNGSLESVLREIRKQTGYNYALQDQWKAIARPVDIVVNDVPVEQALNLCFKNQPFTYTIIAKTIVIEERKPSEPTETIGAASTKPPDGISGVIENEEGKPLAGATVELRGLEKKGVADERGAFFFRGVPAGKYELEVSFIGYERYRAIVYLAGSQLKVMVSMKHSTGNLDQVQIIAYGTVTKRLNTGDVTTIKAADIETQPVSNPILALEGRIAGMFVVQGSGLPGSAAPMQVQIRGINSLTQGSEPLYVVDGVPYVSETPSAGGLGGIMEASSGNPFNFLNPADIESIDVLKDADATAIYGSRGANGVVLITTKKGKEGDPKVNMNIQSGAGNVAHRLKVLNTPEYLEMRHEAFDNDGASPNPSVDYDLLQWDTTRSTDWQKQLIGGTARYTDIQLSASGGNSNTQFLIGTSYHKETTVFPGDWNDQKGTLHFSINNMAFDKRLNIFLTGGFILDYNHLGQLDLTQLAVQLPPDAPAVYKADGSVNWAPNASGVTTWPGSQIPVNSTKFNVNTSNFIGSAGISYKLLKGLVIKMTSGYTNLQNTAYSAIPFASIDPATWPTRRRESTFGNNRIQSWIIEPQLTYSTGISGGVVNALIGATIEQNTTVGQVAEATGFNSDLVMGNILAATTITALSATSDIYKYAAIFGRVNYNWQDKYLLNITARRDGSSRFGPDNRFANFYAAGAGWIFSKEKFFEGQLPWLSFGKLRGSYGTTGNDQIGDYTYLDLYNNIPNIGVPYQGTTGILPVSIFTPNLQWEITKKAELGLDLGFFKDRVLLGAGYYESSSTNQLVGYPLPAISGFTTVKENLPAVVENKGVELELHTVNYSSQNFRWSTSFNFTENRNVLAKAAEGMSNYYIQRVGYSLNSTFLYHYGGVDPITGVNEFVGAQGERVFQPNQATDKTTAINLLPTFFGGFQNSFRYKNFQLDLLFQFVSRKAPVYLYSYIPGYADLNQPTTVLSRWQRPGDVTGMEKFSQNATLTSSYVYAQSSDQVYGDASYIRLKNLSISYMMPKGWLRKAHIQETSVYVHAQNLLTFTRYQGLDPETMSSIGLPPLRVITLGVQLTL